MERQKVTSSDEVESVGYDSNEKVLEVEFPNGSVYQYYDVPPSEYKKLMQAECIHRHLNVKVKCAYPFRCVS